MSHATQSLATYAAQARNAEFPALARKRAVDAITDCIACMLAGANEPVAAKLFNVIPSSPASRQMPSLLVGRGAYAAPADAALFNGTVAHALDYDDTNHPGYAHVGAPVVATMLALAPKMQATGKDLVAGYILGLEVIGKLGRALNPAHLKQGWHPTATFGTVAAAAVAGHMLHLDEHKMALAIGIAASAAGGWRANFGTMVKPLHGGYAARNGVLAALLAQQELTATENALEHRYGYCNVLTPGGSDLTQLEKWGESLEILTDYGLALKPYPSCGATHAAIEAALILYKELDGAPIRSVRAGVSELAFEPLIYVVPKTPLEGKFSLHYCIAAALITGAVNLETFTEKVFSNQAIHDLIPRITMEADDRVRHDPEFATVISVETESGKQHESLVPLAVGKPERWFSEEQILSKFLDCTRAASDKGAADRLYIECCVRWRKGRPAATCWVVWQVSRNSTNKHSKRSNRRRTYVDT